jgi:hypothetical protein
MRAVRYFTRGWATGELDDDEHTRVLDAYARRLEAIERRLPESMRRLAHEVNLHDALIEQIRWRSSARELVLELVAGDIQAGYQTVKLRYVGALLGRARMETLRAVACSRETSILYDEVDIDDKGELTHRLLFEPRDELTIDFAELRLEVRPRADRRVHLGRAFREDDGE